MSEKSPKPVDSYRFHSNRELNAESETSPRNPEALTEEYRDVWRELGETALKSEKQISDARAELKNAFPKNNKLKKGLIAALVVAEVNIATIATFLAGDLYAQIRSEGLATIQESLRTSEGTNIVLAGCNQEMTDLDQENAAYAEEFLRDLFGDDMGHQYLEDGNMESPAYLATKIHAALTVENPPEYTLEEVLAQREHFSGCVEQFIKEQNGVWKDGKGVCLGMALRETEIMHAAGLTAKTLSYQWETASGEVLGHAVCLVELNGQNYVFDPTFEGAMHAADQYGDMPILLYAGLSPSDHLPPDLIGAETWGLVELGDSAAGDLPYAFYEVREFDTSGPDNATGSLMTQVYMQKEMANYSTTEES